MKPLFESYKCKVDYIKAGVQFIEPMLAKEIEDVDKQIKCMTSPDFIIEEKLDGVREIFHIMPEHNRFFSRRISVKTDWFAENSDLVPHMRDLDLSSLAGTILDGEMSIPDRPFKDVSSTLNCKWDKAIERQKELGKIVFNAFDILFFKGKDIRKLPLYRRKYYLEKVIQEINSEFIRLEKWHYCNEKIQVRLPENFEIDDKYPQLLKELSKVQRSRDKQCDVLEAELSARAYYEFLVATDKEGVILKPKDGKYRCGQRGYEYSKIKKLLTKDVIIIGYSEPTDEYKGKFPTVYKWNYWETVDHDIMDLTDYTKEEKDKFLKIWSYDMIRPISKFYAEQWVGNIKFGVIITDEEIEKLPKNKKFTILPLNWIDDRASFTQESEIKVIDIGECSGFDEEMRAYITEHRNELLGTAIEVQANEIFKDTGKLRHPRFFRLRPDKKPLECTWKDHLN